MSTPPIPFAPHEPERYRVTLGFSGQPAVEFQFVSRRPRVVRDREPLRVVDLDLDELPDLTTVAIDQE